MADTQGGEVTQEVSTFNQAMLDRNEGFSKKVSVMDGINKIKIYNANTFKNEAIDPVKAGKFRLIEAGQTEPLFIEGGFKVNILSICKVKSGSVYMLDEFGDTIKDDKGNAKKGFFMTNEHSIYTKKVDRLGFKQLGQDKPIGFFIKEDLEKMLKSPRVGTNINPFWKQGKKMTGEPYNDTVIKDTIILYGKFVDGPRSGEYFKFVPVSMSGYGTTYKDGQQIAPLENTLLYALNEGLKEWNKMRVANNRSEVKSVDPSQLDMIINFREVEIQNKQMFIPTFTYAGLTGMREDNTKDIQYIVELQSEYLFEEFGIRIIPNESALRLPGLPDTGADIDTIDITSIVKVASKEIDEEHIEITDSDVEEVFPPKPTLPIVAPKVANITSVKKQVVTDEVSIGAIPF